MCIRDSAVTEVRPPPGNGEVAALRRRIEQLQAEVGRPGPCLLYTSDAADERSSVDLGGRRIIKKKKKATVKEGK